MTAHKYTSSNTQIGRNVETDSDYLMDYVRLDKYHGMASASLESLSKAGCEKYKPSWTGGDEVVFKC